MPETESRLPAGLVQRYALATGARGAQPGDRRATEVGTSLEFFEERPYQPGDDPRAVNWRGYARTGRLSTRLFHAERATTVHILVDSSASMQILGKRAWAHATIRVLAVAARSEASLQLHVVGGPSSPPLRGPGLRSGTIERFLADAQTKPELQEAQLQEPTSLASQIADHLIKVPHHAGSALTIVVSDLLDPAPLKPLLHAARARRTELLMLHTLAYEERHPNPADLELHDVEDGSRVEVGPEDIDAYHQALHQHEAKLRHEIQQAGHRIVALTSPSQADTISGIELETRAFHTLVRRGVLLRR